MSASAQLTAQNGIVASTAISRSVLDSPLVQQGISIGAAGIVAAVEHFFSTSSPLFKGAFVLSVYAGLAGTQHLTTRLKVTEDKLANRLKREIKSTNKLATGLIQSKVLVPKREQECKVLKDSLEDIDSSNGAIIQLADRIAEFTEKTQEGALEANKHLLAEKGDLVEDKRNLTEELRISTEDAQRLRDYQAKLERRYDEQKDKLSLTERQLRKVEADFDTMKKELNEQLAQKNQEIAGLKHQIAVLKQDMALLTKENNRLTTRIEDLERRTLSDEQLQEFEEMRASFRKQKKSERND